MELMNLTDRARRALQLASQESQRMRLSHVDTGQILLGLLKEGGGVAASVLQSLRVNLDEMRNRVQATIPYDEKAVVHAQPLPFNPSAIDVLRFAGEEAVAMGHKYVGTEHLLLGLLRKEGCIACHVLKQVGVGLEDVRGAVLLALGITPEVPAVRFDSDAFLNELHYRLESRLEGFRRSLQKRLREDMHNALNRVGVPVTRPQAGTLAAVIQKCQKLVECGEFDVRTRDGRNRLIEAVASDASKVSGAELQEFLAVFQSLVPCAPKAQVASVGWPFGSDQQRKLLESFADQDLLAEVQRRNLLSFTIDTNQELAR